MLKPGDEICLEKIIKLAKSVKNLLEYAEGIETLTISLEVLKNIKSAIEGVESSLTYEKNKLI